MLPRCHPVRIAGEMQRDEELVLHESLPESIPLLLLWDERRLAAVELAGLLKMEDATRKVLVREQRAQIHCVQIRFSPEAASCKLEEIERSSVRGGIHKRARDGTERRRLAGAFFIEEIRFLNGQ